MERSLTASFARQHIYHRRFGAYTTAKRPIRKPLIQFAETTGRLEAALDSKQMSEISHDIGHTAAYQEIRRPFPGLSRTTR